MKFRAFNLKDDINQGEYVAFRVDVQTRKPDEWDEIDRLPIELLYGILIRAAIHGGWVEDVVEKNEYDEDVTWQWTEKFIDEIPAGEAPLREWGHPILERWLEYKGIDPN